MEKLPKEQKQPLVELLLSIADDKLMLGHRNADWTGLGPLLEEDIAFSSLAQDDLAHASALYALVAELTEGDADAIAYGRKPEEYRCAHLVETADDFDWAVAIVRQFYCDHFEMQRLARLAKSGYEPLRALAVRLLAEERLSLGHADQWIVRLGRGCDESRDRIQVALDKLAPLTPGLFEPTEGVEKLKQAGVYPRGELDMFESWANAINAVIERAVLTWRMLRPDPKTIAGRRGKRSEAFAALHEEMTEVYRVEPQAKW